ncbi:cobalt-precorrin-6A reductase [uncultured Roseovarius sp.]|uniref:cobalt-precorrin-6A reductase n=1 Tax=uncultured Roseovarius sp. TaxID=293344 RepID=UPI00259342FD|nr:cobalt-precorrin-6A reductase [uncultured Roseovarius sp.]
MTLLLLAGTTEAQRIAQVLARQGISAVASLSGATHTPKPLGLPTRVGGFGGEAGFRACLADLGITAVLDATHPFAADISHRTARVCAELGLPYCQVLRPEWRPEPGDDWVFLDHEDEAGQHIPPGSTVFLATGRQTLERFAGLSACHLICRVVDPPEGPFPFPKGDFLVGRPPFQVESERETFARLEVDWLVVKNAGGEASRAKLTAARELGVRVAMLNRPAQPDAECVETVQAALDWVVGL